MRNWEACFEALRIPLILLGCVIVGMVILCLFLNWSTSEEDKEHARKRKEIEKSLIPNWSLRNAMIINRETGNYTPCDVRLGMVLYRTPEESDKYIEDSLKRPLP